MKPYDCSAGLMAMALRAMVRVCGGDRGRLGIGWLTIPKPRMTTYKVRKGGL